MHMAVVHNPLCAITKECKAGHITILDGDGPYFQHRATREWAPTHQHNVVSVLEYVGFAQLSNASQAVKIVFMSDATCSRRYWKNHGVDGSTGAKQLQQ